MMGITNLTKEQIMQIENDKDITFDGISFKNSPPDFGKHNLVIGENGAGKTRFLKSVEELLRKNNDIVLTLYFPEERGNINGGRNSTDVIDATGASDATNVSLIDVFGGKGLIDSQDFIQILERASDFTFQDVLIAQLGKAEDLTQGEALGLLKQDGVNAAFNKFKNKLHTWLDRTLETKNGELYVTKYPDEVSLNTKYPRSCLWAKAREQEEMSPGELNLYYLAFFLYCVDVYYASKEKEEKRKIVLLIDEPEVHLHTKKLLELVDCLIKEPLIEQLWVASHSIFLVPKFEFAALIYIEKHIVYNRSSKTYGKIVKSLVGANTDDLFKFVTDLDNWEYYQFIVECFRLPEVRGRGNAIDPQFLQLRVVVEEFYARESRLLRVLDYGAGECRIWECLNFSYPADEMKDKIIYVAYDPGMPPDFKLKYNEANRASAFDNPDVLQMGHYDIVILMNVLHEIPVSKWETTLKHVHDLLNEQGVVVFIEVCALTEGEQPNEEDGFIVLNDNVVKKYFTPLLSRDQNNGKSNCWVIPREHICLSREKIMDCIVDLRDDTKALLQVEFEKRIEIANAKTHSLTLSPRKYAFHSQQYINTMFAIDKLVDRPSAGGFTEESIKGKAAITKITGEQGAVIAGAELRKGEFSVNDKVHVHRGGTIIHTGNISQLERTGNFNDRLQIGIKNFSDLEVGDVIEAFTTSNA